MGTYKGPEPSEQFKEWGSDAMYLGDSIYFRVDKEQFRGILFTADGVDVHQSIYLEPALIVGLIKIWISTFNIDKGKL